MTKNLTKQPAHPHIPLPQDGPWLSVVIPLHNEAGNLSPLLAELCLALDAYAQLAGRYEVLLVDDGSTDGTWAEMQAAQAKEPRLRLLQHTTKQGMSPAIRAAVKVAHAPWIMTCDGDGQNNPADMPAMLGLAWGLPLALPANGWRLVCGIRVNRQDTPQKRMVSRIANKIRQWVLHDGCPDTGCALKLFPRALYLQLPFFHGLHRFMPALCGHYGAEILQMPVHDRPRRHGVSKSDITGRAIRGLFDLLGVYWLLRRTPTPLPAREIKVNDSAANQAA